MSQSRDGSRQHVYPSHTLGDDLVLPVVDCATPCERWINGGVQGYRWVDLAAAGGSDRSQYRTPTAVDWKCHRTLAAAGHSTCPSLLLLRDHLVVHAERAPFIRDSPQLPPILVRAHRMVATEFALSVHDHRLGLGLFSDGALVRTKYPEWRELASLLRKRIRHSVANARPLSRKLPYHSDSVGHVVDYEVGCVSVEHRPYQPT